MNQKKNNNRLRENRYRKASRRTQALPAGWQMALLKVFCAAAAIGAMSLMFVFGYQWLTRCDYFRAENVEVSGVERLSRKRILKTAKIAEGVNILSVNISTARKRLLALPWVANVEIRRKIPDTFMIRVHEHMPVAVIELDEAYLVNNSGEIFMETGNEQFQKLPVISGVEYRAWKADSSEGKGVSESVMEVVRRAMKEGCLLPFDSIKKINVDPELGLTVTTEEFPAEKIHLGFGGYESKYRRLSKIFSYLKREGAPAAFKELDLRYEDRIVARPAEDETNLTKLQKEA
ncbi:MAG: FtsQ-type POTRA domain-containing protein [Desulfobacteraceae bacterium]|nr:FtsQ-type POTRA domain-containing protein [Desulfobacteraceae bacterium]